MAHDIPVIEAEPRTKLGSRYANRLRAEGKMPAVLYGHGIDAVHITIDGKLLLDAILNHAHLIEVNLEGKVEAALIKDLQWDHLGRFLIHADLTRVDRSERVEVDVEIQLVGSPKALEAAGAVLEHPLQALTVACRADSIPEVIKVSIGELTAETPIHAGEIALPEGVELVTEPETLIASITMAREEEEVAVDAEGGAEPEVIGKAKGDEENDA